MSDLQDTFAKKLFTAVFMIPVLVLSSCQKNDPKLEDIPKGNPEQVILTVNGISVTEDRTDGKLGAYLSYNPYATEEEIKGARKTIAHSVAEMILVDEFLKKEGLSPDEKEIEQASRYLEFFYKDAGWIQKNAEFKNISAKEMYKDHLLEYKKMKILGKQTDIDKPTRQELNRFIEENRQIYGEKPERKIVYQILVRHEGIDHPASVRQAKEKLEKARTELQNGGEFREVAKKYSDLDPDAPLSCLGAIWADCYYYGETIAEMIRHLNPGECSEIYDREGGSCSVFYIDKILPREVMAEEDLRHWLEMVLILQKNEIRYHLFFEELYRNADIVYSAEYDTVTEL